MPSSRNAWALAAISGVGYDELSIKMSWARITMSTARRNDSVSNPPSSRRYFSRLSDARLHAELSRCIYSEQGLDALMRAVLEQVCQSLIVVSYCMPGSPQKYVLSAIMRIKSRALKVSQGWPSRTYLVCHSRSS